MTFHLMFVHIIYSSVWVAEWPPFGKELSTRMTICSHCILTICILVISWFGFLVRDLGFVCFSFFSLHTC